MPVGLRGRRDAPGVLSRRFRANPRYELVRLDELPPSQRALFRAADTAGQGVFGVLRPRASGGLTLKAVCRDTARLYLALGQPAPLPGELLGALGPDAENDIVGLVLDGVLEMEADGGGDTFVCGAAAHELVPGGATGGTGTDALSRLSVEALRHAQDLHLGDPLLLSARLYFFHRIPVSPSWIARLPTPDAVTRALRLDDGGAVARLLARAWSEPPAGRYRQAWRLWRRPGPASPDHVRGAGTYKLYVSSSVADVGDVFAVTVEVAGRTGARGLKVARDVYGLLRPDKLVVYFDHADELRSAGADLRDRLRGCPPHGVPFTAQLDDVGLLSWGIDPPAGSNPLVELDRESWRLWVTNHLASSLVAATTERAAATEGTGGARAPWEFALHRLEREGVDVHTWAPSEALWSGGAGE